MNCNAPLLAAGCAAALVLSVGEAHAQPVDNTQRAQRGVGATIWVQVPYSVLQTGVPRECCAGVSGVAFAYGGGSVALTVADWIAFESGYTVGESPTGTSVQHDFVLRAGATPVLYDARAREGAGIALQGVAMHGYRFLQWDVDDYEGDIGADLHFVAFSGGLQLTHWWSTALGISFRALADVGVLMTGSLRGFYFAEGEVFPRTEAELFKEPLRGCTLSIGLAL